MMSYLRGIGQNYNRCATRHVSDEMTRHRVKMMRKMTPLWVCLFLFQRFHRTDIARFQGRPASSGSAVHRERHRPNPSQISRRLSLKQSQESCARHVRAVSRKAGVCHLMHAWLHRVLVLPRFKFEVEVISNLDKCFMSEPRCCEGEHNHWRHTIATTTDHVRSSLPQNYTLTLSPCTVWRILLMWNKCRY